jgi:thiol:disulfide interchange protein
MKTSSQAKRCFVGAVLGALFGLILGLAVVAAIFFSGLAGARWDGKLQVVGLLTALCAVGGSIQGWLASSKS